MGNCLVRSGQDNVVGAASANAAPTLGLVVLVNVSELLINVVTPDQPKALTGWSQKARSWLSP
ncbi:MAG: hypothetical protein NVSMB6_21190 [Burkholderiaceae bacterium]